MKQKRSEETQPLRAGCSKAEPKNFSPAADPIPGGAGRQKFSQLEMVTTFTYKPSLVRINAHNFELSSMVTDPPTTHKHTHRQVRLQYTAPQLASAQRKHIVTMSVLCH